MRMDQAAFPSLGVALSILVLMPVTAFAESPQFLKLGGGAPTFPINAVSKAASGGPVFETGITKWTCSGDETLNGELTSLTLGVVGLAFMGCILSTNGEKCTTAGDAAGVILLGTTSFHLVAYKSGTVLLAGLLFLGKELEVSCGAVTIRIIGSFIGLFGPLNLDATNFTLLFDHTGVIQKPTSCEDPVAVCLPGGITQLYSLLSNWGLGLEHAILILKQPVTTGTDLLIDA